MEFDTIDTDIWSEIHDMEGEIFDFEEFNETQVQFTNDSNQLKST